MFALRERSLQTDCVRGYFKPRHGWLTDSRISSVRYSSDMSSLERVQALLVELLQLSPFQLPLPPLSSRSRDRRALPYVI